MEDFQLNKDIEEEIKLMSIILYQNNHKVENCDNNINVDKVKTKDNNIM